MAAQLAHQLVVLGVGDLGVVEDVVPLVVVGDEGPQLGGPGHRVVAPAGRGRVRLTGRPPTPPLVGRAGVVQGHGLARGHPALGRGEPDRQTVAPARAVAAARAGPWALHWAQASAPPARRRPAGRPADPGHGVQRQADAKPPRAGPTVTRRVGTSTEVTNRRRPSRAVAHPPPLAHGDQLDRVHLAQVGAAGVVDQAPRVQGDPVGQEAGPAHVGPDEAHVLAVRLGRGAQPEPRGLGAHLRLGHPPHREQGAGQLVLAEHGQHVGLVLGRVGPPDETPGAVGVPGAPGVVAGGHGVEPEPRGPLEEPVELEVPVALDAGVGRAALRVAGDVGIDDVGLEVGGEVEDVVDQAQLVGHPPGVVDVGDRAAAGVGRRHPTV